MAMQNSPPIDLAASDPSGPEIRAIRGAEISMIFQEPMTSFSPVHTIGFQIGRVIEINRGMDRKAARREGSGSLDMVGIAGARQRVDAYPVSAQRRYAAASDDRDGTLVLARVC